jgi:cyclopropane fatty-acyl-phospholipid synthase-like methyltransferase
MTSCPRCSTVPTGNAIEDARLTYATGAHPVAREVELRTLGSDFGANGYATLSEVDQLIDLLELGPGRRLLDVGAGQGWPGLYLARTTRCAVVLTDVPFEGPAAAAHRAASDGTSDRAWPLLALGQSLPLRRASVDAVVHTDVLCCLAPKLATLRATRQALRPGGRTAFSVIYPTPGLPPAQARRAVEAGPPHCRLRGSYPRLLRSAGFVDIDEHDLTPAYLATARTKLAVADELADGMADMLGQQEFDDMQAKRRLAVSAIADGLLRRSRFIAQRPHR